MRLAIIVARQEIGAHIDKVDLIKFEMGALKCFSLSCHVEPALNKHCVLSQK